jgi:hypothetical protein
MFTLKTAKNTGDQLGVDWSKFSPYTLRKGMNVETEHKDITHDDPVICAKIALSHLNENFKYYKYLKKMEVKMTAEEKPTKKLNVFMEFCKQHRSEVKGMKASEQGKKLGEMYRAEVIKRRAAQENTSNK